MRCVATTRARQWFFVTLVGIALYIVAVQRVGVEHINASSALRSYHDSVFRLFAWVQYGASAFTAARAGAEEDPSQRAQIECRGRRDYVPGSKEIITNRRWALEWDNSTLGRLASGVHTNTTDTIALKSLPYLKNFKNPCWLENLTSSDPYFRFSHRFQFAPADFQIDPGNFMSRTFHSRLREGKGYRMRCLPYYFIIGPQKTGTTDLFEKMNFHPLLRKGRLKEPHFWPRSKNQNNLTLTSYIDLFDEAADDIASNFVPCREGQAPFHPMITGEATAETMWDNWFWKTTPENAGFDDVTLLTAHHIRHVIPHARIIAILRDPVERLVSDFYYFGHSHMKTAESFDTLVDNAIGNLTDCYYKENSSRKTCIYNHLGNEHSRPTGDIWDPRVRLRIGLYAEFLEDWFSIFPSNQIHLINFDDYVSNRTTVLNTVFDFLGLEPLPHSVSSAVEKSSVNNQNSRGNYMHQEKAFSETKEKLRQFYIPFNEKLAKLSKNNDFLKWNDVT